MSTLKEPAVSVYHFDDVVVDCENFRVVKGGEARALAPRAFDLLVYLIEHRGRVVEKRELFEHVWKEAFVTDNALTKAVKEVRRALGDAADAPRYIETVPRRGYRFAPRVRADDTGHEVQEVELPPPAPAPETAPSGFGQLTVRQSFGPRRLWPVGVALALIAAAVLAVVFWRGATPWPAREAALAPKTTQITSSSGLDLYPAVSPDGNAIAYCSDRGGSFEIYVKQLAPGGRELQVTADGGDNLQPAWSPDGRLLAFTSRGRGGVWAVPALGGVARRVSEFGSRPAWSPDGALIAFQSGALTDLAPTGFTVPRSTLWVVPAQGGAARELTRPGGPGGGHAAPSWSPDGKRLIFATYDMALAEVWSVALADGALMKVVANRPLTFDPVYAPDGRAVYFSGASPDKNFFLYRLEVAPDTGEPRGRPAPLAHTGGVVARHMAVGGGRLFYSLVRMNNNIWAAPVAAATGEPMGPAVPLTDDTGFRKSHPSFSPDGRRVVFSRWVTGTDSDVWVADADGRNAAQLTADPANEGVPVWLADGNSVAIISDRAGRRGLWALTPADGAARFLLEMPPDASNMKISPDGRRVAFHSRRGGAINVWAASLDGGEPAQLTFGDELQGFPCWSPDGRWLAFERQRGDDTHVAVMPAAGGTPAQLTFDRGQSWTGSWSPDGGKIAFAGYRGGRWNIWWVARAGGRQRQVTTFARPNVYVRFPAWSPAGDRIAFEYAEITGNVWMMELK